MAMLLLEQVESVLGEDDAALHLDIAGQATSINYEKDLAVGMVWGETPQGHAFWTSVYNAIAQEGRM